MYLCAFIAFRQNKAGEYSYYFLQCKLNRAMTIIIHADDYNSHHGKTCSQRIVDEHSAHVGDRHLTE